MINSYKTVIKVIKHYNYILQNKNNNILVEYIIVSFIETIEDYIEFDISCKDEKDILRNFQNNIENFLDMYSKTTESLINNLHIYLNMLIDNITEPAIFTMINYIL